MRREAAANVNRLKRETNLILAYVYILFFVGDKDCDLGIL